VSRWGRCRTRKAAWSRWLIASVYGELVDLDQRIDQLEAELKAVYAARRIAAVEGIGLLRAKCAQIRVGSLAVAEQTPSGRPDCCGPRHGACQRDPGCLLTCLDGPTTTTCHPAFRAFVVLPGYEQNWDDGPLRRVLPDPWFRSRDKGVTGRCVRGRKYVSSTKFPAKPGTRYPGTAGAFAARWITTCPFQPIRGGP